MWLRLDGSDLFDMIDGLPQLPSRCKPFDGICSAELRCAVVSGGAYYVIGRHF